VSNSDFLFFLLIGGGLLAATFRVGTISAREDMIQRLLGMKRVKGRWEVREGTEMMGMKWVARHWIYEDEKEQRPIRYNEKSRYWEFEDGTRPENFDGLPTEVPGHWETAEGQSIDPTKMKHLDFTDALLDWASKVGKFLPLGIESLKIGLQVTEQNFIIKKYGEVLEQSGSAPLVRKESDLPVDKARIRIELAKALLNPELNEEMKNNLSVAFASLEFFLNQKEFDTVGAAIKFATDPRIIGRLKNANQPDLISELNALTQAIVNDPGDDAVWNSLVKRSGERLYQSAVLKEIASGNENPNMANLIAKVDTEVEAAGNALKSKQKSVGPGE